MTSTPPPENDDIIEGIIYLFDPRTLRGKISIGLVILLIAQAFL